MTLSQLQYILAVYEKRNFVLAAESCFVTQPTLSMQIQKLEDELGVPIFDRKRQPVEPTDLGLKILEQARLVLDAAKQLQSIATNDMNEIGGELRLGIIPTLAPTLLPLFLRSFLDKHTKVRINVEELQTQQIIDRLKQDQIDVGILATPLSNSRILERPLFYEPFVVYMAADHPLHRYKRLNEKDLSNDVWLLNEGHCFRDQVLSLCGDPNKRRKSARLRLESGNLETLRHFVNQSGGYTLLPWLASAQLAKGEHNNHVREFSAPIPTREVSLVHSPRFTRLALLKALEDEIKTQLPSELKKMRDGTYHRVGLPKFD